MELQLHEINKSKRNNNEARHKTHSFKKETKLAVTDKYQLFSNSTHLIPTKSTALKFKYKNNPKRLSNNEDILAQQLFYSRASLTKSTPNNQYIYENLANIDLEEYKNQIIRTCFVQIFLIYNLLSY